jgi:translation initiation factor 4A
MTSGFDAQLKTSPFMHDLVDRLVHCEYSTRDIQRDLNDIQRKVNLLLERALTTNTQQPGQPEFKDPFATTNGNTLGPSLSQPRPSIGNIAPNQHAPLIEDMPTITQRLNALTTSVGQLLALQTQQMQQTAHPLEARNSIIGLGPPQDIAPNQLVSPPTLSPPSLMGHTLSNRPDLRPAPRQQPNTPMRTWSSGTLDMPIRASESAMSKQEPIVRDKSRRSVSGLLRRDSSGVSVIMGGIYPNLVFIVIIIWLTVSFFTRLSTLRGIMGIGIMDRQ